MANLVAYRVLYRGQVQGVGFRATACRIAARFPVAGWVRNLPDSRVEMLVEGAEADVMAFLQDVRAYWEGYIEEEQIDPRSPSGLYRTFDVVR